MRHENEWSPDQQDLREGIETAVKRLNTKLPGPEGAETFPSEGWRALAQTGLFGLPFKTAYGGLDADLSTLVHVFEGFGKTCSDPGFAFAACTHLCAIGFPLARFGSDALNDALMPKIINGSLIGAHAISEPDSGSSAFDMKTRAVEHDDFWRLTGQKTFVSNAPFADLIVVYACTDPGQSALTGFSAFVVPTTTPGLKISEASEKIGLKTSQFGSLYLDDVNVPKSHMLGRRGLGFSILDYVMKREILVTFAGHLGQLQTRFDLTRDYVRGREQFGQRISAFQSVSNRVVDNFIEIETARMWLYRAAQKVESGAQASREVAVAKLLCSEANLSQAIDSVRLHGAAGYLTETGIGGGVADALGGVIYSGTSDIQRNRIAATLGL